MTVFWDNVSSRDPKGTINAKVTYWDNSVKSASPYNQKILTLKDMNPPSLTYSKGTTISFGEQTLLTMKTKSGTAGKQNAFLFSGSIAYSQLFIFHPATGKAALLF